MKPRNISYSVAFFLLSAQAVNAQSVQQSSNKWSVGLQVGNLYDIGEYRFDKFPEEDFKGLNGDKTRFDLGVQLYIERQITPLWGLQLGGAYGTVTGANSIEYYEGEFYNFSMDGLFVLSNLRASDEIQRFRYYLKGGVGLGSFESNQYLIIDNSQDNSQSGTFGQYRMGGGLQYQLNPNLRLELEVLYTTILNDGFDGYNNSSGRDALLNSSIGIAYTFGSKEYNPLFSTSSFSQEYIDFTASPPSKEEEPPKPTHSFTDAQVDSMNKVLSNLSERLDEQERQLEEQQRILDSQSNQTVQSEEQLSVFFAFDASNLSREEMTEVFKWVSQLGDLDSYTFEIIAYTDEAGSEEYNAQLRERRSQSMKAFLEGLGVSDSQISIIPSDDSASAVESFLKRRVQIIAKPVGEN